MWVEYVLSNQLSLTVGAHFPEYRQFDIEFATTLQLIPFRRSWPETGIELDVLSNPRVG